jgi:tetratricopeptide (TPR) repeat protein
MRVFLCHSSKDKLIVEQVWNCLGERVTWLDKAELEWGDVLVEKVAAAIEEASDFLLFWSRSASESGWVRFELHMGFVRLLEGKGCKLRVVLLDDTALPLYLRPFLFLDVKEHRQRPNYAAELICGRFLSEGPRPRAVVRKLALDRNEELERIEQAVNSRESQVILVQGLYGIGKRTLVKMAVERFFAPPDVRTVTVRPGTGWVELALQLSALAGIPPPPDGANHQEIETIIRASIETIHSRGALIAFYEVQHWVEEDGTPAPIFNKLLEWACSVRAFAGRPVFLTSTRLPEIPIDYRRSYQAVRIGGLSADHVAALIRHWLEIEKGQTDEELQGLKRLGEELYGYPIAARIAASLVGQYGVEYLLSYRRHIIDLRVDIAKDVIAAARVSDEAIRILQVLALLDAPLPEERIANALGLSDEVFREAGDDVLSFGLATMEPLGLTLHPLVRDFYWRTFALSPSYKEVLQSLIGECRRFLQSLVPGTERYAQWLPTVFRLMTLAGDLKGARQLRSDLFGTLLESAIQLYRRREYPLALEYVDLVLNDWPDHWGARLYRARCLTRLARIPAARALLNNMVAERSTSVSALHEMGRTYMEDRKWGRAIEFFKKALEQWSDHLPSLRDSAECYVHLEDLQNALGFVERAESIEPRSPYVLQIKSIILEKQHGLEEAYKVMQQALQQDPGNAAFEHRLGRIAEQRGPVYRRDALEHYNKAAELDDTFMEARLSRLSVLVDLSELTEAEKGIGDLRNRVYGKSRQVLRGIEAKLALEKGELDSAMQLVRRDWSPSSCALRAKVEMRRAAKCKEQGYTELARRSLDAARRHLVEGLEHNPNNTGLLDLERELQSLAEEM